MIRPRFQNLVYAPLVALAISPLFLTTACFDPTPKTKITVPKFEFDPNTIAVPAFDFSQLNIPVPESDPRAKSKDPVERRAYFIENTNDEIYDLFSLRYKIIQSRALILYLGDILPSLGSPHKHMADFAGKTTKEAFKAAQKNSSKFMGGEPISDDAYWLPVENGKSITAADLSDEETKAVYNYFAQYIATAIMLKNTIQPIIEGSIVVESIEDSAGADVKAKFDKAWGHIQYIVNKYSELLAASDLTKNMAHEMRPKVVTAMIATIAEGMKEYIGNVENASNKEALKQFVYNVAAVDKLGSKALVKKQIAESFNKQSNAYNQVVKALENVDLPDSGSIDGSEESFEAAMRLELGFDILKKFASEIETKW